MTDRQPRDLAASAQRRLLNIARERREDHQLLLMRYALQRLLYRLSRSAHGSLFVLKGAMLFEIWMDRPHRPTRDLDLLGYGESSIARMETIFRDICAVAILDDGVAFPPEHVKVARLKEGQDYEGLTVRLQARIGTARVPVHVDIGFGDVVTPAPVEATYPVLLGQPAPVLRTYPMETVVAEKYQTMVTLGLANSRMKDFFDLWVLSRTFPFDGRLLSSAMQATFARRETSLQTGTPEALTSIFVEDPIKQAQWQAFTRKGRVTEAPAGLDAIVEVLRDFLMPPTEAIVAEETFAMRWPPGGPWVEQPVI